MSTVRMKHVVPSRQYARRLSELACPYNGRHSTYQSEKSRAQGKIAAQCCVSPDYAKYYKQYDSSLVMCLNAIYKSVRRRAYCTPFCHSESPGPLATNSRHLPAWVKNLWKKPLSSRSISVVRTKRFQVRAMRSLLQINRFVRILARPERLRRCGRNASRGRTVN